jgi:hypothetical protein
VKGEKTVEVVHVRCAGLDISKKDAKVCVRVAGAGRRKTVETVTTWSSMTSQILALREHLIAERITCAVMEATSDYWKPFYYLLEDAGFEVLPGHHLKGGTSVVVMADRTSLPASDVDHRGIHHWRLGVGAAIQRLVQTSRNGASSDLAHRTTGSPGTPRAQ